jgi:hypothetical protein
MIVEIPNWPLSQIEVQTLTEIITNWVFSFFKSERQSYVLIEHETLFLEF